MNSKTYLILAAAVVVVIGLFAVRNLQNTTSIDGDRRTEEAIIGSDDAGESRRGGSARIGSIESSSDSSSQQRGQRITRRSPGAAALEVTPATRGAGQSASGPGSQAEVDQNLSEEERRQIADLTNMYRNETDPEKRAEIAEELGAIDSRESVRNILDLLTAEDNPEAQLALIEAMEGLDATEEMADEIFRTVSDIYTNTNDEDVKVAAQSLMGDLATESAAAGLRQVMNGPGELDRVRIHAAETLLRMGQGAPDVVPPNEVNAISETLRNLYQNTDDARTRQYLIMAMALDRENIEFFVQSLPHETDPQNMQTLERLISIYTAAPPQPPPPGTVVTPVPTLAPTPPAPE